MSRHPTTGDVGGDRPDHPVTAEVVDSFAQAGGPRTREVLQSLVSHLHQFVQDVGLTEEEWWQGINFLTQVGHTTTEQRQEFILLSDVLGLSMLTVGLNNPSAGEVTESTVFGPFFVGGSPEVALGGDLAQGAPGRPCWIEGTVRDQRRAPVPGARLEVWEADEEGLYDVQRDDGGTTARGHLFTDHDGSYRFWSVLPAAYPIPDDGPVGDLLDAGGRGPMRPAHVHFMISAAGHRTLVTHIFAAGDPYLDNDAVFGVKDSLITDFVEQAPGAGPDGSALATVWYRAAFDFVLADDEPPRTCARRRRRPDGQPRRPAVGDGELCRPAPPGRRPTGVGLGCVR